MSFDEAERLAYVCIATVENVEGAVVDCCLEVVQVILHFHFHAVPLVVLATLEPLVAILFTQSLHKTRQNQSIHAFKIKTLKIQKKKKENKSIMMMRGESPPGKNVYFRAKKVDDRENIAKIEKKS